VDKKLKSSGGRKHINGPVFSLQRRKPENAYQRETG